MKSELSKQLVEKYPKIFRSRRIDPRMPFPMFGFECNSGWFNLIDTACSLMQSHIDSRRKYRAQALLFNRALNRALKGDKAGLIHYFTYSNRMIDHNSIERAIKNASYREVPERVEQVTAAQVKEKFGTLRFYVDNADDFCQGVVTMAECMSESTCETCGAPGKIRGGSWLRCECDVCHKNREYGNEKL